MPCAVVLLLDCADVPMCRPPPRDDGMMTALFFGNIIAKKIRTSRQADHTITTNPTDDTTRRRPKPQHNTTGNYAPSLHVQVPRGEEGLRLPLQACTHRRFRRWQVLPPPALCRELPFLSVPSMSMAEKNDGRETDTTVVKSGGVSRQGDALEWAA